MNSGISLCVTIKDQPTQTYNIPPIILELLNAYSLLEENMGRYPKSGGHSPITGSKPQSNPLINLRLFDKKNYVDFRLENLIEEIYQSIHFK